MPIIKEDKMNNYHPQEFTFQSVKSEVSDAMRFDWKRDKVDDAKKRAIYEAKSYDDFEARVKGCTLKPIHRGDFNAPPKYAFNRSGGAGGEVPAYVRATLATPDPSAPQLASSLRKPSDGGGTSAATLPKNSRELERELRRRTTSESKAELICLLDGDACARIFTKELDAEVLRQMLEALEAAGSPEQGCRLLKDLAIRCPSQTGMAATFLTPCDRGIAARLLAAAPDRDEDEDVQICAAFGVPVAALAAAVAAVGSVPNRSSSETRASSPPSAEANDVHDAMADVAAGVGHASSRDNPADLPRRCRQSTQADGQTCDDMD